MWAISMKLATLHFTLILEAGSKLQYFNVKCIIEGLETTGGEREISKRGEQLFLVMVGYGHLWLLLQTFKHMANTDNRLLSGCC